MNDENNDWTNSQQLFHYLELKKKGVALHRIPPTKEAIHCLYAAKVFCEGVARLITPNPVLNRRAHLA